MDCDYLKSKVKYPNSKKRYSRYYLINFHPAGEPEAFICCVIKGSA
jgi:hypothetical protein